MLFDLLPKISSVTRNGSLFCCAMSYDPPDRVFAYAQQNKLPFRVTLDIFGKAMQAFGGIRGTPTTFLVDKRGRIVRRWEGEPDFDDLAKRIETELRKVWRLGD